MSYLRKDYFPIMLSPLYKVSKIVDSVFPDHKFQNYYLPDNTYLQLLVGDINASGSVDNFLQFDNKFSVEYDTSFSGIYNSTAYSFRFLTENNWNSVSHQTIPGIWRTPSYTGGLPSIVYRFQQFSVPSYYYGDEVANGGFRLYYLPLTSSFTGSSSTLITQNVLRFLDINHNTFGPSFSITGASTLTSNLSATTSAISVDIYFRPIPQDHPGFLWHRWTSFSGSIISEYQNSGSGTLSAYPYYSGSPYYGIGCKFNKLTPVWNSDSEAPYIDFYVYGGLTGNNTHYLDLTTGLIAQATNTRFLLRTKELTTLFDGSFHSLRAVWSTNNYYQQGRLYLDGEEIPQNTVMGDGRATALDYSLNTSQLSTPFYFLSSLDNALVPSLQTPSQYSSFGETKHIVVFDSAISGTVLSTSSVSANSTLFSAFGSTTANLASWFGFNSITSSFSALDLVQQFNIKSRASTGTIVNDSANAEGLNEGTISSVLGLFLDKKGEYVSSLYDSSSSGALQREVGKIYHCEYEQTLPNFLGTISYSKGLVTILDDAYNVDLQKATQLFVTSPSSEFSFTDSSSSWQAYYLSVIGRTYVNRKVLSISADAQHFAKSTNPSSLFRGTDGKIYSRSNKKFITGVVFFDNASNPLLVTKMSEPIYKNEDTSLSFDIIFDA